MRSAAETGNSVSSPISAVVELGVTPVLGETGEYPELASIKARCELSTVRVNFGPRGGMVAIPTLELVRILVGAIEAVKAVMMGCESKSKRNQQKAERIR